MAPKSSLNSSQPSTPCLEVAATRHQALSTVISFLAGRGPSLLGKEYLTWWKLNKFVIHLLADDPESLCVCLVFNP